MTVKIPIFIGAKEIEGLLFAKERFDRAARCLSCDTGDELFDNFEGALSDLAEQCWENVVDGIGAAVHTGARFRDCFDVLVLRCSHEHARDHMED
jgi:hypothetical protein